MAPHRHMHSVHSTAQCSRPRTAQEGHAPGQRAFLPGERHQEVLPSLEHISAQEEAHQKQAAGEVGQPGGDQQAQRAQQAQATCGWV